MTESFLHYIWQYQYFDKVDLCTTSGDAVQVFKTGFRNDHAGPDFHEAKIKIGNLEWRGSVEIHIRASGWNDHHHDGDPAYENVILHVVWENDKPLKRTDGSEMPTLELKDRVDRELYSRYKKLFTSPHSIPCSSAINQVSELVKLNMLEKAFVHRLQAKSKSIVKLLDSNKGDWEESAYQWICRNFGFKVNSEAFFELAKALPLRILQKHAGNLLQIEALLFGQAGFLTAVPSDAYTTCLKREHALLSKKYGLTDRKLNPSQWRFLRLRPANFPTLRLAQLATLINERKSFFSSFTTITRYHDLYNWLAVKPSEYWHTHYRFGKKAKHVHTSGKASIQNIIINTVIPLLGAYAHVQDDETYLQRAADLAQHLPAENNKIIREWRALEMHVKSAFDSQALIELFNSYCMNRRCLECNIGASIVKPRPA